MSHALANLPIGNAPNPDLTTILGIGELRDLILDDLADEPFLSVAIQGRYPKGLRTVPRDCPEANLVDIARYQRFGRSEDVVKHHHTRMLRGGYPMLPVYLEHDITAFKALWRKNRRMMATTRRWTRSMTRAARENGVFTCLRGTSRGVRSRVRYRSPNCQLLHIVNFVWSSCHPLAFPQTISRNTNGLIHITPTWCVRGEHSIRTVASWLRALPRGVMSHVSFGAVLTTLSGSTWWGPMHFDWFDPEMYFCGLVNRQRLVYDRLFAAGNRLFVFPGLRAMWHRSRRDNVVYLRQVSFRAFDATINDSSSEGDRTHALFYARQVLHCLFARKMVSRHNPRAPPTDGPLPLCDVLQTHDRNDLVAVVLQQHVNKSNLNGIKTWTPWEMRDLFERWLDRIRAGTTPINAVEFPGIDRTRFTDRACRYVYRAWRRDMPLWAPNTPEWGSWADRLYPPRLLPNPNLSNWANDAVYFYHHPSGDQTGPQDEWRQLP